MKIECYMSMNCSSREALRDNIYRALELEGLQAGIKFIRVTDEVARRQELAGSPSVLVDGEDIMPAGIEGFS